MPTPVIMPKYEMTQETGKIARWLKSDGDVVEKGDPLLEIETDKTNIEVESRAAGVLPGSALSRAKSCRSVTPSPTSSNLVRSGRPACCRAGACRP